ncbi:peptidyl-tRNA hydrolase [Kribbella albertanoniae]|uniref:peptidyl-tRNA hydrolase n=1 Tax=Kribbella albertanoniae TaxID=1266829 RepID=UPI001EDEBB27|nr:peptidyl-tRNA hydrolase [Kribbella albertanoniae]
MEHVLTLVIRVEKNARPQQTDALEAAAHAVLAILADDRSIGAGEWAEAMAAWQDHRIRKVVRRARGAEWRRAEALPGITVTHGTAEVRVFPPVPLDDVPKDLAKLQVTGTDFDQPEPPAVPHPSTPVLWVNPALQMSSGKTMAQVGHGAHLAWLALSPAARKDWATTGFPLVVRTANPAHWTQLLHTAFPVVQDAGFTEITPGSRTVIAEHPGLRPS